MSEIRTDTISAANGTDPVTLTKQSAAKAWVNFNGSGTISIRDSQNVSGLVDNGSGDYTANISSNMSNANYSASFTTGQSNDVNITNRACCVSVISASLIRGSVYTASGGARIDMSYNGFKIHGDLA